MKDPSLTPADREIIAALDEFREALGEGNTIGGKLAVRTREIDLKARAYDAADVRQTRELLGASQDVFASLLGVSSKTVRSWERGDRGPNQMARRFMDEIQNAPSHWKARLGQAMKSGP